MSSATTVENTIDDGTISQDAATALSQGKRYLMVRDYGMAVAALAQACGKLAEDHGDMSDELGEPFLLYGRALLGLSREEAGVLGTCMPEGEEEDDDEDDDEEMEEGEEEQPAAEESENKEKEKEQKKEEDKEKVEEKKEVVEEKKVEEKTEKDSEEVKKEEKTEKDKEEVKKEETSDKQEEKKVTDEQKPVEKKEEKKNDVQAESSSASSVPSSSKDSASCGIANGGPSTSKQNGTSENRESSEEADDEEEEANSNLQVAWEVLELAKLILTKRGDTGQKLLAEAHRLLGEVAMESGNQVGALTDLTACLDLLRKIEPVEPRSIAEIHYQLGLAYSLGNEFDSSIEQFQEATNLLETRIKELESSKTDEKIENEIKDLKELLPEIQDKITDMRDFKQQAAKKVLEDIKNRMATGSCSNGAGPSGESSSSSAAGSSSSPKPASDISHLVRKKKEKRGRRG